MIFFKNNSTLIPSSFQLSTYLFLIFLPFLGSCASTQGSQAENQTVKKDTLAPAIESKTPIKTNLNTQKDSVDLSTALGLPIEVPQNETASGTESSNSTENSKKDDDPLTTKKSVSPQANSPASIVEDTFESNQKFLFSTLKEKSKKQSKTASSEKPEKSSETQWGSPIPEENSDGVDIAQKLDFHSTHNLSDVFFNYDAFKLDSSSKAVLKTNAEWLSKNPMLNLEIHGHCDERGTNNYNLGLGEKRALTVKNFLAANGITHSRIHTVSFGEEKPFCLEKTEEFTSY